MAVLVACGTVYNRESSQRFLCEACGPCWLIGRVGPPGPAAQTARLQCCTHLEAVLLYGCHASDASQPRQASVILLLCMLRADACICCRVSVASNADIGAGIHCAASLRRVS